MNETPSDKNILEEILEALNPNHWTSMGWFWLIVGIIGATLPFPFTALSGCILFPPLIRFFEDSYFRIIDQWASCLMTIFLSTGILLAIQENVQINGSTIELSSDKNISKQKKTKKKKSNQNQESGADKRITSMEEISLQTKKMIFSKIERAHKRASRTAKNRFPARIGEISEGFKFQASDKIRFDGKCIIPDSEVTITKIRRDHFHLKFFSEAYKDGCKTAEGWLSEKNLRQQKLNLHQRNFPKQQNKINKLTLQYEAKILEQYNISDRLLTKIVLQGIQKNWSNNS